MPQIQLDEIVPIDFRLDFPRIQTLRGAPYVARPGDVVRAPSGGSVGFNPAPYVERQVAHGTTRYFQPGAVVMPSFNFGGSTGFGGSNGGLASGWAASGSGGGWVDVANTGLNILGGWAMNRAAERQMRRLARQQGGYNTSPYMNQNPNLGAAPVGPYQMLVSNPNTPTTRPPLGWPMNNPSYALPTPARGPSAQQSWDTGIGVLDEILNGITDDGPRGGNMATPVVMDQNGNACVVRKPPPPRLIGAVNNQTGKSAFYRYVGAPILFRGDLATLKTVKKAVSKFGGLAGARRPFRARRRR